MDDFANLSEEALRAMQGPLEDFVDESEPDNDRYYDFQWELYDWSKFDPKSFRYEVIRLMGDPNSGRRKSIHSGKYFSILTRSMRPFVIRNNPWWYPHVEYRRDDRGEYIEPLQIKRITAHYNDCTGSARKVVYMHRLIAQAEGLEVGDHINGYSLDNRNCNLRPISTLLNQYNARRTREAFPELLPGVQWTDGRRVRVYGIVRVNGDKLSSGTTWTVDEQEEAWKWCAKKKLELFGLNKLANGPRTVPLPKFPPRLRKVFPVRTVEASTEIPF